MTTYTIDDVRAMLGRPVLTPPVPKAVTAAERAGYEEQIAALRAEVEQLRAELATVTSQEYRQDFADTVMLSIAEELSSDPEGYPTVLDKQTVGNQPTKKARK